jgi:UDP-N-acetylmuramate dehydrogenase
LELPSCGSVFKNPPGDYAGRLIESVGLRGHAIGGARISERHCNFIVNEGGARADEVVALIALARQRVWEATGVRLEPEVHVLGPRSPWPPPIAGDP